jgi:uncharacterized membrane protein (DUF2068 family)
MARFPGVGGCCKSSVQILIRVRVCRTGSLWAQSKASETMKHHALDRRHFAKRSVVLRTIAMFEVTKAAIVILLGWGLFLMHRNLADVAERVVQMLHVNPEGKLTNLFFELASHASGRNLWVLALSTLAYASMRSTEAYGLWREREWAQWCSLLSTALYLPPELYWMLRDPSWLKCAVLVINIVTFLFMVGLRVNRRSTVARGIQLQSSMRTGDQPPAGTGSGVRS